MTPGRWTLAQAVDAKLQSGDSFSINVWFVGQRMTDEPARFNLVCVSETAFEVRRLCDTTDEAMFINLDHVIAIEIED